jgi:predicted phage-related endonuclease
MSTPAIIGVGPTVDHSTYLGGSDIASIVGLSPWGSALDVWARKTGRATFPGNKATRAGNAFERPILAIYAEDQGVDLEFTGTLLHGITGATPDAISSAGNVVQCKMVGFNQKDRWGPAEIGADAIPQEVLAQVHYEAWHAEKWFGRAYGAHAVAQIGTEQRVYEVAIDPDFSAALVEAGGRFWRDHVVTGRMPIVKELDMKALRLFYQKPGKLVRQMSDAELVLAQEYAAHRDAESASKKAKEAVGVKLCQLIGDDTGLVYGLGKGVPRVTWSDKRGKIDWKACAKAMGATDKMAEQYRAESARTLRVYLGAEDGTEGDE